MDMKYSVSVLSVVIMVHALSLTYLGRKTRSFGYACSRLCCVCAVLCVFVSLCTYRLCIAGRKGH